jgi:hypothetical protein
VGKTIGNAHCRKREWGRSVGQCKIELAMSFPQGIQNISLILHGNKSSFTLNFYTFKNHITKAQLSLLFSGTFAHYARPCSAQSFFSTQFFFLDQ